MLKEEESKLRTYVERLEALEEQKKSISDDMKDVLLEAKSQGFDAAALKTVIKLRKLDPAERKSAEDVLDVYRRALGIE